LTAARGFAKRSVPARLALLDGRASHCHMHDVLAVHVDDEEREDGPEPNVVDLQAQLLSQLERLPL
jgi:hypothetical protein